MARKRVLWFCLGLLLVCVADSALRSNGVRANDNPLIHKVKSIWRAQNGQTVERIISKLSKVAHLVPQTWGIAGGGCLTPCWLEKAGGSKSGGLGENRPMPTLLPVLSGIGTSRRSQWEQTPVDNCCGTTEPFRQCAGEGARCPMRTGVL